VEPILDVRFYATELGGEPVREWLKLLSAVERKTVGEDIKTVQFGWPLGMPLVRSLGGGIWEPGKPHCSDSVRFGRLHDGVAAWIHQEDTSHTAS
jgi:hypothetical protein